MHGGAIMFISLPTRNPLIEPNNVGVLADVENESTGTRPEPVNINHGCPVPRPFLGPNQPLLPLALSFLGFSSRLVPPPPLVPFFFPVFFFLSRLLGIYPVSLSPSPPLSLFLFLFLFLSTLEEFYSSSREHVCADVGSSYSRARGNALLVVIFQTRETFQVPKQPHSRSVSTAALF